MEAVIETMAKTIFESWGGPWTLAPEFRKQQARHEALSVVGVIKAAPEQSAVLAAFLAKGSMNEVFAGQPRVIRELEIQTTLNEAARNF